MLDIHALKQVVFDKAAEENSLDAGLLKFGWVIYKRSYVEGVIAGAKMLKEGGDWRHLLLEWENDITPEQEGELIDLFSKSSGLEDLDPIKVQAAVDSIGQVFSQFRKQALGNKPEETADPDDRPSGQALGCPEPLPVSLSQSPGCRETSTPRPLKTGESYEIEHHGIQARVKIRVDSLHTLAESQFAAVIKTHPQRKAARPADPRS